MSTINIIRQLAIDELARVERDGGLAGFPERILAACQGQGVDDGDADYERIRRAIEHCINFARITYPDDAFGAGYRAGLMAALDVLREVR
jgi:hypothetical protein